MNIFDILLTNYLLLTGVCKDITEAMNMMNEQAPTVSTVLEKAQEVIRKGIQGLARDLMLLGSPGSPDLWKGVNNLPIEKQYSLRKLRESVTAKDVVRCLYRMSLQRKGLSGTGTGEVMSVEEMHFLYRCMEPMFILLDKEFSEKELMTAYQQINK